MKRKPILVALAPLLVVGAALWGVNTRLDHPPLTDADADKEFRALVAGADSVQIYQFSCQPRTAACSSNGILFDINLNATQTDELTHESRFSEVCPHFATPLQGIELNLKFRRRGKQIAYFRLSQTPRYIYLSHGLPNHIIGETYKLNPRFVKPFNRTLDAYLPQRIRP